MNLPKDLNACIVGSIAKLEHRLQVQLSLLEFLQEKIDTTSVSKGIPFVKRDPSVVQYPINRKIEEYQCDTSLLSEVKYFR